MLGPETWIVLVAGGVSAVIAVAIARLVRNRRFEPEDVTLGFLGPSLAAMYLLVLALSLATEWQTIGTAEQSVGNEAVAARQLYLSATGLPPASAAGLRSQARGYVTAVLAHDWPQMEHGTLDDETERMLANLSGYVLRISPASSSAGTAQQFALSQINALAAARAQREAAAETELPYGVLAAVIATSLVVSVFPFAGGIRPAPACIALAALQAAMVTVGVVVVFQLNHAFAGPLAANQAPLTAVAQQISAP